MDGSRGFGPNGFSEDALLAVHDCVRASIAENDLRDGSRRALPHAPDEIALETVWSGGTARDDDHAVRRKDREGSMGVWGRL